MDPLAKQLKRLRAARGLSQEALARKAHVSRGYLARIELGRHDPTLSVLRRLAKGLRVSVGELAKRGKEKNAPRRLAPPGAYGPSRPEGGHDDEHFRFYTTPDPRPRSDMPDGDP